MDTIKQRWIEQGMLGIHITLEGIMLSWSDVSFFHWFQDSKQFNILRIWSLKSNWKCSVIYHSYIAIPSLPPRHIVFTLTTHFFFNFVVLSNEWMKHLQFIEVNCNAVPHIIVKCMQCYDTILDQCIPIYLVVNSNAAMTFLLEYLQAPQWQHIDLSGVFDLLLDVNCFY